MRANLWKCSILVSLALLEPSLALGREQVLLSEEGSVAATRGTGNKIITHGGKRFVAWMDKRGAGFVSIIKALDLSSGKWSPEYVIGVAKSDHGRPALTLDSQGYLHTVYGIHQDRVPYRRSVRPLDASEWTEKVLFGGRLSYPTLLCGADDTLFLSGRYAWDGVRFYAKPPKRNWEDRGLIIRVLDHCFSYAAFHEGIVWGPEHKTMHLACRFFQSTTTESIDWGSIQSANYMRSHDSGRTWERASGAPITMPATSETMDVLIAAESMDPKPNIFNDGAIVVDSRGSPYVLYFLHTPQKPGQVFLVKADPETGKWRQLPLQEALHRYYPGWAVVDSRSGFTITEDDRLYMALTVIPVDHPAAHWDGKPKDKHQNEPGYWSHYYPEAKRIAWLESTDAGNTFTAYDVLDNDPRTAELHPSIEMDTGFHGIPAGSYPALLYHTGTAGLGGTGEDGDIDVFYVDVTGSKPLLPPPSGLSSTPGSQEVLLDWDDAAGEAKGYNVYRAKAPDGPFIKRNVRLLTRSRFSDATTIEGVTYLYTVRTVYGEVESEYSFALPVVQE